VFGESQSKRLKLTLTFESVYLGNNDNVRSMLHLFLLVVVLLVGAVLFLQLPHGAVRRLRVVDGDVVEYLLQVSLNASFQMISIKPVAAW